MGYIEEEIKRREEYRQQREQLKIEKQLKIKKMIKPILAGIVGFLLLVLLFIITINILVPIQLLLWLLLFLLSQLQVLCSAHISHRAWVRSKKQLTNRHKWSVGYFYYLTV